MSINSVRRLASLGISLALILWSIDGQRNAYQLAFGLAVYGALCYHHGWRMDRREMPGWFIIFYALPFSISATVIAIHIAQGKML